ncbi:type II secretion system protein GspJ [Pseudomonas sp. H3(2019)]|uniref:type II secretion system protein GspJ n=1 Tax=Pseudomonas sp. H3(2019) TaxID=2598724 RepID=UPI0011938D39|nr:type II secretion system protein GspJ [Pseudomonas sp. H3(2019)]TVT83247.1 prepilin-type N-terminal cleavage/methylation domain-containing protein [Pseudomonas sp. H3(2019)]
MNKQNGFTLLELVIAMAIFALISLASWRLFDGVVRAERSSSSHERDMRALQRAVAVIERDALQVTAQPMVLQQNVLQLQRGNWRNPLDEPRSELQNVTYRLDKGTLWRESHPPEQPLVQRQRLLTGVRELRWRLYDLSGWRSEKPLGTGKSVSAPKALEITFSTERFESIRRVLLLPGSAS